MLRFFLLLFHLETKISLPYGHMSVVLDFKHAIIKKTANRLNCFRQQLKSVCIFFLFIYLFIFLIETLFHLFLNHQIISREICYESVLNTCISLYLYAYYTKVILCGHISSAVLHSLFHSLSLSVSSKFYFILFYSTNKIHASVFPSVRHHNNVQRKSNSVQFS